MFQLTLIGGPSYKRVRVGLNWLFLGGESALLFIYELMQFSTENYITQSKEYNNLLHVRKVRAQCKQIHGLTIRAT